MIGSMRLCERVETPWQRMEVWSGRDEVEFRVEGAVHAWWHRDRLVSGLAWDNLAASCLLHPSGKPADVLMLGLGGGTSLRLLQALLPEISLTAVEIDPVMIGLARKHMELDGLGVTLIEGDAREVVRQMRRKFDVVVDDLYLAGTEDVVRCDAGSGFSDDCLRRLRADGILVANLVTGPGHRRVQSRLRQKYLSQFPVVKSVRTPDCWNECLVGGRQELGGAARLREAGDTFENQQDLRLWRRVGVRRLYPTGSGRSA